MSTSTSPPSTATVVPSAGPGGTVPYRDGPFRVPRALAETGRVTLPTLVGEAMAAFLLLFIGTGAIVMYKIASGPKPDLLPIALAWTFAVVVIVYAFGHVSGAHANPAVTMGLTVTGKFPWKAVPAYLGAQFAGMLLASLAVWAIFGEKARAQTIALGTTLPGEGSTEWKIVLTEAIATAILLCVVMATATDDRAESPAVGLGVGLAVGGLILCTATVTSTSLNPIRTLAPMIVTGYFPSWPAYVAGPLVGGVVGALLYEHVIRSGNPPEPAGAVEEHERGEL